MDEINELDEATAQRAAREIACLQLLKILFMRQFLLDDNPSGLHKVFSDLLSNFEQSFDNPDVSPELVETMKKQFRQVSSGILDVAKDLAETVAPDAENKQPGKTEDQD